MDLNGKVRCVVTFYTVLTLNKQLFIAFQDFLKMVLFLICLTLEKLSTLNAAAKAY